DLSIKITPTRILLHCFAQCSTQAICESLNIQLKDLFLDARDPDPARRRTAAQQRERQRQIREKQAHQHGTLIDCLREADRFIRSRRGLDSSSWSDAYLARELNALADAYLLLEREDLNG